MQRRARPVSPPPARSPLPVLLILIAAVFSLAAFGLYLITTTTVQLRIGDQTIALRTHQTTVGELFAENSLYIEPQDLVTPPLTTPIQGGMIIIVDKAQPYIINADERDQRVLTRLVDTRAIVSQAGITVSPADSVVTIGNTLVVRRARPFMIQDNGRAAAHATTGRTVGDALSDAKIVLYAADLVTPALDNPFIDNMTISITRATPITIVIDNRTLATRVQAKTVADALTESGAILAGLDTLDPPPITAITPNLAIKIRRITETEEIESIPIPFKRILTTDPALDLDEVVITQTGQPGAQAIHTRVRREDGVAVSRSAPLRWITTPPIDELGQIGSKLVIKKLDTPDGAVNYWRSLTVRAKAYRPLTSGKLPTDPAYGVTSTGQRLEKGTIAVDPAVIPLGSEVYIPGYGRAFAGDTLPGLTGLAVRLGYGDRDYQPFEGVLTVYLIAPVPAPGQVPPLPIQEGTNP